MPQQSPWQILLPVSRHVHAWLGEFPDVQCGDIFAAVPFDVIFRAGRSNYVSHWGAGAGVDDEAVLGVEADVRVSPDIRGDGKCGFALEGWRQGRLALGGVRVFIDWLECYRGVRHLRCDELRLRLFWDYRDV